MFDRSGHAIVRTDVLSEKSTKGESLWMSKYLGLVEDVQSVYFTLFMED